MPLQNTIEIKPFNIIQDKYVPLTDQDTLGGLIKKLNEKKADPSDFWATLGRQDNGSIRGSWAGKIVCSKQGNNSFTARGRQIQAEAQMLASLFPDVTPDEKSIYEKFVALKDLQFTINDPRARMMRLTVTLKPGEHAVMFLQHTDITDTTSQNGVFEYILPEREVDPDKQNLLTYLFELPVQPSADGAYQTVIKVMTFKTKVQKNSSPDLVRNVLAKFDTPYMVKLYDRASNNFIDVPEKDIPNKIDNKKKTLLLIHGTFSSTAKSYGDTVMPDTWLQSMVADPATGKLPNGEDPRYGQIIAFDHYTIIESPAQNAAELFRQLQPIAGFAQPVDIITTSRGGLVGKSIVNNKQQKVFSVDRVATVACANGVQYMTAGQNIGRFLGLMKLTAPNLAWKAVLFLAQRSAETFLAQPGLMIMNKDFADLKALLADSPANKDMRYYPVCGLYSLKGNHPVSWKFVDVIIGGIMHNPNHDWVVETDFQAIMPATNYAYSAKGKNQAFYRGQTIDSTHTRYFNEEMTGKLALRPKKIIFDYLHDKGSVL